MRKCENKIEAIKNLIKYCEYLFNENYKGEYERGYRYGVQHIQDK